MKIELLLKSIQAYSSEPYNENYKEEIQISSGGDGTQSMDEFVTHVSKRAKNLPRHR